MLSVFELKFEKTTPFKDKLTLLQSASNLQLLRSPTPELLSKIIVKIKLFLEDSQSRLEGLLLLHTFLGQCADNVFEEHAFIWARYALQVIQGSDPVNCKEMACTILKIIITNAADIPEVRTQIGEKVLPDLISSLLRTLPDDQWLTFVMDCVSTCMKEMSGFCIRYKADIENFLMQHMDCSFNSEVEHVANCFMYLPLIGERSTSPAHYAKYWTEQVEKVIGSLSRILNILYHDLEEEKEPQLFPVALSLPEEPENEFSAILCCTRRFQTLACCLAKMLCCGTRHPVNVPIQKILMVIDRGMSVSFHSLNEAKTSNIPLGGMLPTIHASVLIILEALILNCHDHLIVQEAAIRSVLLRNLSTQYLAVEKVATEEIHCSNLLLTTTYRVMRLWIEKLHPISLNDTAKELCSKIVDDINPKPKLPSVKGISARNYLQDNGLLGGGDLITTEKSKSKLRISVCLEALQLLSSLLRSIDRPLCESVLKIIQDKVVNILVSIQQSRNSVPVPYSDDQCRQELYKVFLYMVIHSQNSSSTPLSAAMAIFLNGQRDTSIEISRLCCEASSVCLSIIHPERIVHVQEDKGDTLHFSTDSKEHINIDSVQSTSVTAWDTSLCNAGNQVNQVTASPSANVNSSPVHQLRNPGRKDNSVNSPVVNNRLDQMKQDEEDCELVDDDLEMEEEGNECEEEEEEPDEEDEEDEEEEEEEEPEDDTEDMNEGDSVPSTQFKSTTNADQDDNSNSNINGFSIKVIKENGYDTSEESGSSLPEITRKRRHSNDELTSEAESHPKKLPSVNEGNCVAPEAENSSDLPPVEDMIQDFVPCSPDSRS